MGRPKKVVQEFEFPTDPEALKRLKECVESAVEFKREQEDRKESIKEIAEDVQDTLGMPKSLFNKLVKTRFKDSLMDEVRSVEELDDAYTKLYPEGV